MNKKDGGPAFPETCNGQIISGMTMRDYFAGQALQGLATLWGDTPGSAKDTANAAAAIAYSMADAMLTEREARK